MICKDRKHFHSNAINRGGKCFQNAIKLLKWYEYNAIKLLKQHEYNAIKPIKYVKATRFFYFSV